MEVESYLIFEGELEGDPEEVFYGVGRKVQNYLRKRHMLVEYQRFSFEYFMKKDSILENIELDRFGEKVTKVVIDVNKKEKGYRVKSVLLIEG